MTHFLAKKTVKNWQDLVFDHFWPKRGSCLFKFWDQIWNPLVICRLYDPFLLKISIFEFFVTHYNFKISNYLCSHFLIPNFWCQIWNQCPRRHRNGWCSHHIAQKWWSQLNLPQQQCEALSLSLWNIRSCFASTICHREAQLVSISRQRMSPAHIFQNFTLFFLTAETNWAKKKNIIRLQTPRPCQHEKCSN